MVNIDVLTPTGWTDYELLDSGEGRKLERFGPIVLVRPEQQAIWSPRLPLTRWEQAHAVFAYHKGENKDKGETNEQKENWQIRKAIPRQWMMRYGSLTFIARLTSFRHLGVFPEQAVEWDWLKEIITTARTKPREVRILNLFAYTGLASIAATQAGAQVVHLDSSKVAVDWARENQKASGLPTDSIRWIIEDALKFVRREARRGSQYDGIIMDPPAFGRGLQGQVWQFAESFPLLLAECRQILSPDPLFFLVTSYDIRASALMLHNAISDLLIPPYGGSVQVGEHALRESPGASAKERYLSTSIFARWQHT